MKISDLNCYEGINTSPIESVKSKLDSSTGREYIEEDWETWLNSTRRSRISVNFATIFFFELAYISNQCKPNVLNASAFVLGCSALASLTSELGLNVPTTPHEPNANWWRFLVRQHIMVYCMTSATLQLFALELCQLAPMIGLRIWLKHQIRIIW